MMSCSAPAWGNKNLQSCTLGSSWAQSLSCTRQGSGCRIPPGRYHGLWTCSASGPVRSVAVCCCLGQASKWSSCWTATGKLPAVMEVSMVVNAWRACSRPWRT